MPPELTLLVLIAALLLVVLYLIRRTVIFEFQNGLLYENGKYVRTLKPGQHWYFRHWQTIQRVDLRELNTTIPGQEVLSSDNVGLKISIAASYKVSDPYLAINSVVNYQEALYQAIQLNVRDIVGSLEVEELLAKRKEIGQSLLDRTSAKAAALGIQLLLVEIKDVMFPGDLKNIFAQVVNARKEGLAALERARGESAALRNLANAARLLDDNPNLRQLRLLQALEKKGGNALVLLAPDEFPGLKQNQASKTAGS